MTSTPRFLTGILFSSLLLVACSDAPSPTLSPDSVAGILIQEDSLGLVVGESVTLSATVLDATRQATARSVEWSSGDPTVATVDADGLVTAVGVGSTTLAASAEGATATALVTVADYRLADEDIRIIDPGELPLLTPPEDRAGGELTFSLENGGTLPEVGEVLVGTDGGGFLVRVTERSIQGNVVVVQTEPAALTDIIETGSLELEIPFEEPAGSITRGQAEMRWGNTVTEFRVPGVINAIDGEITLAGIEICAELAAVEIECPEGVKIQIEDGRVHLSPTVKFKADIDFFTLEEVEATAQGTLTLDIGAKVSAKRGFKSKAEFELLRRSKKFIGWIGPVPAAGEARVSFFMGYEAEAEVSASAEAGFTSTTTVKAGVKYDEDDGWSQIHTTSATRNATPASWGGKGKASVKVYIRPEVELLVYLVAGPSISLTPYLQAEGEVKIDGDRPEESTCSFSFNAGLDAELKARVTFLDPKNGEWTKALPGAKKTLESGNCAFGQVVVKTQTLGDSPDTDGYTAFVDVVSAEIGSNDEYTFPVVTTGEQTVLLTGIADNCVVNGANPQTINVQPTTEVQVFFPVVCTGTTGALQVKTTTTGPGTYPDKYTVSLDGGAQTRSVGPNNEIEFSGLATGAHTVVLEDVPANCSVLGGPERTVTVTEGGTAYLSLKVECLAGGLTIAVTTTGENLDPDGYDVSIDGGTAKHVDPAGSVTFSDVTSGGHVLELAGVADNCFVLGDNPRAFNMPSGSHRIEITVDCITAQFREGNVIASTQTELDALDGLVEVRSGYLLLIGGHADDPIDDLKPLRYLLRVEGMLMLQNLDVTSLDHLGALRFAGLLRLEGMEDVAGLSGLAKLEEVGQLHVTDMDRLISLAGMTKLEKIQRGLSVSGNALLTSLQALSGVEMGSDGKGKDFQVQIAGTGQPALIDLRGLEHLEELKQLQIRADGLTTLTGLGNVKKITGDFWLSDAPDLPTVSGLDNLERIEGTLRIASTEGLTSTSGMPRLNYVRTLEIRGNETLQRIEGLTELDEVAQQVTISDNDELFSIVGLGNATTEYRSYFSVNSNPKLNDMIGLKGARIEQYLTVYRNNRLETLGFDIKRVGGYVSIRENGTASPMSNVNGLGSVEAEDRVEIYDNHIESLSGLAGLTITGDNYLNIYRNTGICNEDALSAADGVSGNFRITIHSNSCDD